MNFGISGQWFKEKIAKPVNSSPWNTPVPTPVTHTVVIDQETIRQSSDGDYIAGFTSTGYCAGLVKAESKNGNISISLFADDPLTAEKDGFVENETINWSYFDSKTSEIVSLTATYDAIPENSDGLFHSNGLSKLNTMLWQTKATAKENAHEINIYPNPATEFVNISGNGIKGADIKILNNASQVILTGKFAENINTINVSAFNPGLYTVIISDKYSTSSLKLLKK